AVDRQAGGDGGVDVRDGVGQGERDLLNCGRALLTHVIAADRDRVELRQRLGAVRERVGDEAHRRLGRVDVRPARDVLLQYVVLDRAGELRGVHALLLADQLIEQQ